MNPKSFVLPVIILIIVVFAVACTQEITLIDIPTSPLPIITKTSPPTNPIQEVESENRVVFATATPFPEETLHEGTTPMSMLENEVLIGDTLILFTAMKQLMVLATSTPSASATGEAFNAASGNGVAVKTLTDYWMLKAYPDNQLFAQSIFETFFGEVDRAEDIGLYLLNFQPQVSPNGRFLLIPGIGGYQNPNGDPGTGLWLTDLQEDTLRQLLPQAKVTTWSPNSESLTYIEDDTLYVLSIANNAQPTPIFSHPNLNWLYARWSPDGQWIAVVTSTLDGHQPPNSVETIWLISPESNENQQLVTIKGSAMQHVADEITWSDDAQYLLIRNDVYNLKGEQISPDFLAAATWVPAQTTLLLNSQDNLRLATAAGQDIATISHMPSKAWAFSHDGQHLAYTQANHEQTDIYIYNLTQQENILISSMPAKADIDKLRLVRWSTNDDYLILDDWRNDSPIWALKANAGSTFEVLLQDGFLIEAIKE